MLHHPIAESSLLAKAIAALAIVLLVSGCAAWKKEAEPESDSGFHLPRHQLVPGAVAMEVAVTQVDVSQSELLANFWSQLDQQAFALETRQLLDANGLRVGVLSPQATVEFEELLSDKEMDTSDLKLWEKQLTEVHGTTSSRKILHERVQNEIDELYRVPTSEVSESASWIVKTKSSQYAGQGEQVRAFVQLSTLPQGSGQVQLVVVPEVHFGRTRPTIGVHENSMFLKSEQAIKRIYDLQLQINLRPGETLVLGPTEQVLGMGEMMFGNGTRDDYWHRLLLVRIVHTQNDDLFQSR